jgi:hypothetical protein
MSRLSNQVQQKNKIKLVQINNYKNLLICSLQKKKFKSNKQTKLKKE